MPLAVYLALQNDPDAAITLSLVMLGVSLAVLVALRGRWFPAMTARAQPPGGWHEPRGAVSLRKGTFDLDVRLEVASSGVVVLLGPNAAGKTTLLRALAGLVPLERGRVVLDGVVLDDAAAGVHVPTEQRPDRRGLPGLPAVPAPLGARQRRLRPARARGRPRARARARALEWLERVGLSDRARRSPGRSPAARRSASPWRGRSPPTRACSCSTSRSRRWTPAPAPSCGATSRRHLAAFDGTCLVITHDPIEALTLADQLVVLEAGRVVQAGTPEELSSHPRSRYVADLVGLNLFRGRADERAIVLAGGQRLVVADPVPRRRGVRRHPAARRGAAPRRCRRARRATSGRASSRTSTWSATACACT